MYCTRNVSDSVVWVGASDRRLALFENLFPIPRGVSYNSYLILDEKTALLDTTDASVTRQYLENVSHSLNRKPLDFLIINHMEPDHCANILKTHGLRARGAGAICCATWGATGPVGLRCWGWRWPARWPPWARALIPTPPITAARGCWRCGRWVSCCCT